LLLLLLSQRSFSFFREKTFKQKKYFEVFLQIENVLVIIIQSVIKDFIERKSLWFQA
jgi:hypothetical protein